MKTLPILLLSAIIFFTQANAQLSMPLGNVEWKYKSTSDLQVVTFYKYTSFDTVQHTFLGKSYFRVDYTDSFSTREFFLRPDTAAEKMYLYDSALSAEFLLYDFNVLTGDTIRNLYNQMWPTPDSVTVDSVVSRNVNGVMRKHVYTKPLGNASGLPKVWIEGVGSTYELMSPSGNNPFNGFELICLNGNGQLLYGDSVNCATATPNSVLNRNQIQWTLYPNPTFTNLFLVSNSTEKISLAFYNTSGQLVKTKHVQGVGAYQIDIANLSTGLYFVQLSTANGVRVGQQKFLKQ